MSSSERQIRKKVIDVAGRDTLAALRTVNQYATLQDGMIIYLVGVFSLWIAIRYGGFNDALGILTLLCAAAINSVLVNWINVQVHEASHFLLFRSKRINDFYIDWLIGSWALHDVTTYRSIHDKHHSNLHTEDDPDREMYIGHTRTSLTRALLCDLCGITTFKRAKKVAAVNKKMGRTTARLARLVPKAVAQLIFLILLMHHHGVVGMATYVVVILVPMFCLFPALVRIRTTVQHFDRRMLTGHDSGIWRSRSTVTNFFERMIIGARMDYHFEHHLLPFIPYYNLKKLHSILKENHFFDHDESNSFATNDFIKFYMKL